MALFPFLTPVPPPARAEPLAELLMQALQTVWPTSCFDLLLDRIEAAR